MFDLCEYYSPLNRNSILNTNGFILDIIIGAFKHQYK